MNIPNMGLTAEQAEALFNFKHNGVLSRIDERGQRCGDLYRWALNPHTAEPLSPLADDDAAFMQAYPLTLAGPQAVTEHALFPAMSAVESINTVGVLVARRKSHRQPHVAEVLQLCRVAMECAALTIWLLRDPSREVRRDRCMSEEMEQLEQQSRFLLIGKEDEDGNPTRYPAQLLTMNAEHRRKFGGMLAEAKTAYTFAKPPSFTKMIRESAQWVDAHVPAHDNGEIADHGLENPARSLYSYGSSFIHGYKWMTDYTRGGTIFTLIADALAVTLNIVECAVCMFEAAARAPGGARPAGSHLPERFEPTIAAWSTELFE
ncbi:hypothetical protein [Mycolicibacterium aubagnense]|uniref:Uncharacterized protein n=1 Tax=Mycolicibacterium aubagnense TaxID=319707 RepID=A0ABM7IJK0_9MYCO|nr:hypothetical protein [Mycolicibacterium aubagnense]TLH58177.1 hypothetical protein C1S80_21215 [Mycolicibacterium aubagnense]WGI31595.1 hypothetical protein QDT91_20525 [Mycolicibacterium aubagnense]BBX86946.1 hypothetical protein MAUB_48190 [Mycolicibacterium aubagnense]